MGYTGIPIASNYAACASGAQAMEAARITLTFEGDERTRLYEEMVAALPRFGEYQAKVERMIPLIAFRRV